MGYGRKTKGPGFPGRHRHSDQCETIPPEDRPTRLAGHSPVMIPRFTLDDARRDIALDRHTFDPGPLLLILRNPVPPRRLQYVVTWEEWNAEAERRGYDAEVQHTPIGDFVRVRSKPGWWKERNDAYKAWLAATERQQEFRPRYPRKRRGQAARAEARARSGTTRAFSM